MRSSAPGGLELAGGDGGEPGKAFLQSAFWGAFKAEFGWKALRFAVRFPAPHNAPGAGGATGPSLLVLVRSLGGGLSFAYLPHGPELAGGLAGDSRLLSSIAEALRPRLPRGCLFIRFDPPWFVAEAAGEEGEGPASDDAGAFGAHEPLRPAIGLPLVRAASDVQPPDTVLLDLGPDEDALLAAMKPKWRYNIRLAEKKGVVVREAGPEALGEFYRLYLATAARDRIALHTERYYARLFSLAEEWAMGRPEAEPKPDLRLWLASHEGESLAGIITIFLGDRAVYLYGASSDEKRNLMPAYALQWAAIKAAKAAGCTEYDFFGIPPSADPGHPMAGLYRFKTGFGGAVVHRPGSWDYALMPFSYRLFRAAEAARAWWFKDFRKRFGRKAG
ncbi:MAG TPA: peptidoglycan bridge formation glycyltransferase FemA/FemB family protein [Rectinemataceae bacterium]|nr:peptidoglycan bridge formation glycyltransferase FemA/FemB family protein [Rectinemataceae bacterium]